MIEADVLPAEAPRHALPSELIHELRTPLNQIIGYSDLLLEQAEGTRPRDSSELQFVPDLRKVLAAGHQLQAIIEDNFYPILAAPSAEPPPPASPSRIGEILASRPAPTFDAPQASKVLVVDDVEANRDVLCRRLESQGLTVATAENGRQALEMLSNEPFDLVLLDIMMPEMDGFEVLQTLKADEHLRNIPVIMISALSEIESVARCIDMGAEDYLTKPFNPTLLRARVGACLDRKAGRDHEMALLAQAQRDYRRLLDLEVLRDDLTHMIIHDLRTPLASVLSGVQTIDAVGDLNPAQREVLAIAIAGGQAMVGIINDLLDVEKLEQGSMPLELRSISPSPLIAAAVSGVSSLAEEKHLMLLWDAAIDLPFVLGDEHKLRRVLINLLGNAIKFTPNGGSVTVGARIGDDGKSIHFSVRDSGEGIPEEAFGRIFEKFGQVESRQGGRTNSTGLGLTFCKLAVETHGGQIGVESVRGEGTTFWFTIPVAR